MNLMILVKQENNFIFFLNSEICLQVVQQLMDEYRAATRKDYINFGSTQAAQVNKRRFNRNFFIIMLFSRLNKYKYFGANSEDFNVDCFYSNVLNECKTAFFEYIQRKDSNVEYPIFITSKKVSN